MITYWWYRHIHFRPEFEKDNRIDDFAEYYMSSNLRKIKAKGDRIRESVRATRSARAQWSDEREKLLKEPQLVGDADYHSIASKYKRLLALLVLIAVGESGLNMFTATIAMPPAGILAGTLGDVLRMVLAVIVTVGGIVAAEQFLYEVLPSRKYGEGEKAKQHHRKNTSWATMVLWGAVLFGVEAVIYFFGWARVSDIEAGHVNGDIAKALIGVSMVVPIIGGGIAWELRNIHDAYKNRVKLDRLSRRINQADTTIERLCESENGCLQGETIAYWDTYSRIKSFKEYFNSKRNVETAPLAQDRSYAANYSSFYVEAVQRYNQHKERQDPLLKLPSENLGVVNRKLGQDHATVNA